MKQSQESIATLLTSLGYDKKSIHFSSEPEYSKKKLLSLEKQYDMNTEVVVNDHTLKVLPKNVQKKWISYYDTFIYFSGNMTEINHIN